MAKKNKNVVVQNTRDSNEDPVGEDMVDQEDRVQDEDLSEEELEREHQQMSAKSNPNKKEELRKLMSAYKTSHSAVSAAAEVVKTKEAEMTQIAKNIFELIGPKSRFNYNGEMVVPVKRKVKGKTDEFHYYLRGMTNDDDVINLD